MDNGIVTITRRATLIDSFESEFKGKTYVIYRFLDLENMNIYTATNLETVPEIGETYDVEVGLKGKKLVVVSVNE